MNIEVTKDKVTILNEDYPHENEYKIRKCHFTFDSYTEQFQLKRAIFTSLSTGIMKEIDIINNECDIPVEVLENEYDTVKLGVYSFDIETVEGQELLKQRTSPSYDTFTVPTGSYEEGAETPEMITPSQYDIYSQALQEGLDTLNEAVQEVENLNLEAVKEGKITTITITKKDGTTEVVTLEDGMGLDYRWDGTSLGVKREDEETYQYVNLKGDKGDPGSVHMIVVQTLPTENIDDSAIYLVPLEQPTEEGNNYAEYVYINGQWELLGKIGVHVDLTDYVKNTDYATNSAGGVIKVSGTYATTVSSNGVLYGVTKSYSDYTSGSNNMFINKATLENVVTGKGLVSNTDWATNDKGGVIRISTANGSQLSSGGILQSPTRTYAQYQNDVSTLFIGKGTLENVITGKDLTTKAYVDGLVGDLENILETLDIGSGV